MVSLAYLIGIMLGDGGVYGNYYTVFCRDPSIEFIEYVARIVEQLFDIKPHVRKASSNHYLLSTNIRGVHEFFIKIGFPKGRKLVNAEIPLLFRDSVDVVRGLFDAEGHVGIDTQRHGDKQYRYPYACLDMIAKPVVIQSHHILSAHSIQSSYHRKQPHSWGKHPQWRLLVKGRENMEKFKEQIGFRHPAKAKRLEEILSEGGILRDHTPRTHDG